jgi:ribonucleoside-diphosphate reductase beta chain
MSNRFSVFNTKAVDALTQPMFMGENVNVSRYDQQKHVVFEKITEKQISFFWRPEEVDVSQDRKDFASLSEGEQHMMISNLKYQTLLDSIQGRSPNIALLPLVSIPELETWIETWSFFETIHSRSYTHIMRNVFINPTEILDSIVTDAEIQKRAGDVSKYYDDLILATQLFQSQGEGTHKLEDGSPYEVTERIIKKKLYLCIQSVNALEAIRFYVSFACTFSFAERELMEGNAKIVKLIARDEALHLTSTQHIINLWRSGKDDPEMAEICKECHEEGKAIFMRAVEQEKEWAEFLFSKGSMIGLNAVILSQYVEFVANQRMDAIGFGKPFDQKENPLPWMSNYLASDNVQVAPQETEISSYLVGQIDSNMEGANFEEMFGDL